MKFKVLIAAFALSLALPVSAQVDIVQEAYEVALTTYRLNGRPVQLVKFREALAGVPNRADEAVTVLHHLERNQVTEVSVNL